MVLAKFRLWCKEERASTWRVDPARPDSPKPEQEPRVVLKFQAVQDEVFGPYTPSGTIEMTVVASVTEHFVLGKEYLLTFAPADEFTVTPVDGGRIVLAPRLERG